MKTSPTIAVELSENDACALGYLLQDARLNLQNIRSQHHGMGFALRSVAKASPNPRLVDEGNH